MTNSLDTVIERLMPFTCTVAPCRGLNPYRKTWQGWAGKDYQFTIRKGNHTFSGYFAGGHELPGDPTARDILAYVAAECARGLRSADAKAWLDEELTIHPQAKADLTIAQFELRYARGLVDRVCIVFGNELANELFAAAGAAVAKGPATVVKPVTAESPVARRTVVRKPKTQPAAPPPTPAAPAPVAPPPPPPAASELLWP